MPYLNIIIISYYAFPYTTISALRISHLANFLAEKGHKIYFIRAEDKYYKNLIDHNLKLNDKINQILVSIKPAKNPSLIRIRFTLNIAKNIKRIIRNEKIDLLLFCSDPFWYLPLGPVFKIFYKMPYIIDFRDIMYRHPIFELHKYKDFFNKITDKFLEKIYIKYAVCVIDVTDENTAFHKKIYKNQTESKFITISNGYDSRLIKDFSFNNIEKLAISNQITIKNKINTGKLKLAICGKFAFYNIESIDILLEIENLNSQLARNIEIIAIGKDNPIFKEKGEKAKYLTFTFYPQMSQKDALNILKDSDILLLNNNQKTALGTKIFDYIGLNKPIFAFVKENYAIWKLLKNFENSFLIQSSNDIIVSLKYIIENNISYLTKNYSLIEEFSRDKQYEKLEKNLIKLFIIKEG